MINLALIVLQTLLLLSCIFPASQQAAEINGTNFDDYLSVGNTTLNLTGVGLLRYWGFKAYVGAFYLEEGVKVENALMVGAKRIEIEYLRSIRGKDFGPATDKVLAKNLAPDTLERLRPKIDYHNSLYEDVKPGDRYSLTYLPGRGTELALNGQPKGTIEGADFAKAIFSIWLGPEPINESFKDQILGQKES